ncbi:DNA circularization N-terminal domain-containing protein [Deltaproteobacteria bacterium OttesenSCG-928-M10]|nr:DNA circularization N-terminal domain-containing protein [Deltaproteobacteria bacterium OttesenSCG-928-M10]
MINYYANLRPASFRGVPFKVMDASDGRGRATVIHEFPLRDQVYVEDLGLARRTIDITAFVIGPEYESERDALIKALEEKGPGSLVHPWLGSFQVSLAEPAQISHDANQAGLVTFQLKFVEDSPADAPQPGLDFPGLSQLRGLTARLLAGQSLDLGFQWQNVTAEALGAGHIWAEGLYDLLAPLYPSGEFTPPVIADTAAVFQRQLFQAGSFSALVENFWPEIDFRYNAAAAKTAAKGLLTIAAETPAEAIPYGLGSIRRRTAENEKACLDYQREMCGVEALRALAWLIPDSAEEARALRETAMAVCDRLLNLATSDEFFQALRQLHTSAQRALAEAAGRAPRVAVNAEAETTPALVIAWRRVLVDAAGGDPDEVLADIARRNNLRHPGFVPVQPVEVLRESI